MPYCIHCENYVASSQVQHLCPEKGLLNIDEDPSIIVDNLEEVSKQEATELLQLT